jgi:hypothetical protein
VEIGHLFWLSALGFRLLAISSRLSALGYQLSAISSRLSVLGSWVSASQQLDGGTLWLIAESRWLIADRFFLGQLTCRPKKISANLVENPVEKSPRLRRCDTDF